jgi:hypothetical protein
MNTFAQQGEKLFSPPPSGRAGEIGAGVEGDLAGALDGTATRGCDDAGIADACMASGHMMEVRLLDE